MHTQGYDDEDYDPHRDDEVASDVEPDSDSMHPSPLPKGKDGLLPQIAMK